MILTIHQYIEALANPDGRFRTLRAVRPAYGTDGEPLFSIRGHGLADFEIIAGSIPTTLRCSLLRGGEAEMKFRSLAERDRGLGSRFFTEWELREREVVLFDGAGGMLEQNVLVRTSPAGETPVEFLHRAAADGDTKLIMSALASLAELAGWSHGVGREVALRRLLFAPDGSVCATGFSAAGELGEAALAFFITAAMPGKFAGTGRPLLTNPAAAKPLAAMICAEAAALGFPELQQISAGDVAGALNRLASCTPERAAELGRRLGDVLPPEPVSGSEQTSNYVWQGDGNGSAEHVNDGAGWDYAGFGGKPDADRAWLMGALFREGRAEVETLEGRGLIDRDGSYILEPIYEEVVWDDYWGLAAVMSEGRWSLLDRNGTALSGNYFDWLGECSEGLVLAQKEGKCGFLDTEGREVIPFVYDDATSFSEGVAFATCGGESFYIDSRGKQI